MAHDNKTDPTPIAPEQSGRVSRRELLAGAAAAAAGVGMAAAAPSVAEAADVSAGLIGVAPPGVNAGEFRSRISQSGPTGEIFTSVGYLTKAAGASSDDLFAGPVQSVSTALFTVVAEGTLVQRVSEVSVHALDVVGTLTVYQLNGPGATYADPSSFQAGTPVAQFDLTIQDLLTVFAPGKGLPTLTGDMHQTSSQRVAGTQRPFGRVSMRARMFATGIGTLTDPVAPHSELEVAGNWTVEQ